MTAPALRLVPPEPPLEQRLAEAFDLLDEARAEVARLEAGINADRALWMARERTFGISREALRKAVAK